MVYYVVPKLSVYVNGTTTYKPDIPDGIGWVGQDCMDDMYLIGTNMAITGLTPLTDWELQTHCELNDMSFSDIINKWYVK